MYPKLAVTLDAYKDGLLCPPISTLSASGENFGRAMLEFFEKRIPPDDVLLVNKCATIRSHGIRAARRGCLVEAEQLFRECHAMLDAAVRLTPEGRMLALTFLWAGEAYLAYRHGENEQAQALVYEAMRIDVALETSHGYPMGMHRIQLACNLVKVMACSSRDDAVRLGIGVLNVLEGDATSRPVPEVADPINLAEVPPDLLSLMVNQIIGELALVLAGAGAEQARRLFSYAVIHVKKRATGNCMRYAYSHDWLAAKQAFLDRDVDCFLMRAAEFLAVGRRDDSTLWFATAVDFSVLCNEFNIAGGDIALEQLANDAQSWERVPSRLLAVIEDLR
ncbi:MAG: hypothetical protein ACRDR6_22685 [Pseudonocardiaceae bacterium]